MNEQNRTRAEIEQKLLARAASDKEFRALLVSNPKSALEKELKLKVPESVDVKVLEEGPSSFYIVLPPTSSKTVDHDNITGLLRLFKHVVGADY